MPYQRRKLAKVEALSRDGIDYYECEACAWSIKVLKGDRAAAEREFEKHECKGH